MRLDSEGLVYEVDLLDVEDHRTLYALVERGDIRQSSFAFICDEDTWTPTTPGTRCGRWCRCGRSTWRR